MDVIPESERQLGFPNLNNNAEIVEIMLSVEASIGEFKAI